MQIEKDRYSINEVSEMLSINVSTLRNHEKEFDLIIPRDERNRRYYTDTEIELFKIIRNARNEGHSIDTIRTSLIKHEYIENQNEHGLKLMPMDKLTPEQLDKIQDEMFERFSNKFADLIIAREAAMQQKYEEKLDTEISNLKKSIKEDLQVEFQKQNEQSKAENEKLMTYIVRSREDDSNKSFFKRLFTRK